MSDNILSRCTCKGHDACAPAASHTFMWSLTNNSHKSWALPSCANKWQAIAAEHYRVMLGFCLNSVDCDVLYSLEDLFLLPPDFQALVVQMNQEVQAGGVSMDQVCAQVFTCDTKTPKKNSLTIPINMQFHAVSQRRVWQCLGLFACTELRANTLCPLTAGSWSSCRSIHRRDFAKAGVLHCSKFHVCWLILVVVLCTPAFHSCPVLPWSEECTGVMTAWKYVELVPKFYTLLTFAGRQRARVFPSPWRTGTWNDL